MIERRIVRRYATALFNAASQAGKVDHVESDLGMVTYTFESSPRLMESIASPVIPDSAKRDIIQKIFAGKLDDITLSYLYLLIDKHREEAILQTEAEFIDLANEARGLVTADVTTAVPLEKQQEAALAAKLTGMTGKTVQINPIVDPSIKGGVIVKIGDKVIDGSIKGQLEALRDTLLS